MSLFWKKDETPEKLHSLLRTLGEEYPLSEEKGTRLMKFQKASLPETLRIRKQEDSIRIEYGSTAGAARGIAYALADMEGEEYRTFQTFGILWDCSRTGVVRADYFKHCLRRMALFGYDTAMLYTKDAYQVPGEPYFGYMRGAYSAEEIREIDEYATRLGIEMVASIQALGHLEPILRWGCYGDVKDTDNVILPDFEKSYILLEKMIRFWSDNLRSRRIHLGMDETHDLGRGRFMDQNGYESPFDIYNRHLREICGVCEKFNLKPLIWNDMYFRYANSSQNYYDTESEIPERVRKAIPPEVTLCYWDYYHGETEFYEKMLERTRELNGKTPLMASGIWTWSRLWYDSTQTEKTVGPCIEACRNLNIRELIFTMWGDDGGYCEFESSFAGMAWSADKAFNPAVSEKRVAKLYKAVCGTDYNLQRELGFIGPRAPAILWDDPLMGIIWHEYEAYDGPSTWKSMQEHYEKLRDLASKHRNDHKGGDIDFAWNVCHVLSEKIALRRKVLAAYAANDTARIREVAGQEIPRMIQSVENLNASFRIQYLRKFKFYGLEIMQIRLAGLRERYRELARRLEEYLDNPRKTIPELEIQSCPGQPAGCQPVYRHIATGGWFI